MTRITKASAIEGTSEEDISKAEESLRAVGVQVRSSAGEFRDMTDILHDLGAVWGDLNDVQQANISYEIAGTRQTNIIKTLLGYWTDYEDLVTKAGDASGTTLENQGKYEETLEAKTKKLSTTMESFWHNLLGANEVGGVIEILQGFATAIDKVSGALGSLGTIGLGAGLFAGIKNVGMFKTVDGELKVFNKTILSTQNNLKNLQTQTANLSYYTTSGNHINLQNVPIAQPQTVSNFTKLNNAFKVFNGNLTKSTGLQNAYIKSVGGQNQALGNYLAGLNGAKASMGGYIASLISAKAATIALQVASMALNMALSMGVAFAIQGTIALFDKLITTSKEQAEKLQNVKQEYENVKSELQSLNDELKTTEEKMTELENKDTLTFTEKKEYDNLVKTNNELQRKIDLLELEEKIKNKEKNKTFVDTMNKSGNAAVAMMGNTTSIKTKDFAMAEIGRYESLVADGITEDEEKQVEYLEGYLQDLSDEWGDYAKDISYINNPTNKDEEKVNEWLDFVNDFQDRMAIAMGGGNAETNAFNRVVDNWQFDEVVQGLQDLGKEGKVTAEMLDDPKYDAFIQKLVDLGVIDSADALDEVALAFNNVGTEAETAGENLNEMTVSLSELKDASDKISTLSSAFKELSDDGYITTETIAKIQEATGLSGAEWDKYQSKLMNAKRGSTEFNQVMSDLTFRIIENKFNLEELKDATEAECNVVEKQIAATLRENGVTNANAVAQSIVAQAIKGLKIAYENLTYATYEEINALIDEGIASGYTSEQMFNLIGAHNLLNNSKLNLDDKIAVINRLGDAGLIAASKVAYLIDLLNSASNVGRTSTVLTDGDRSGAAELDLARELGVFSSWNKIDIPEFKMPDFSGVTSGGKSGSGGSSSDNSTPDYEDPTDAIIDRINLRHRELEQREEYIENAREIAELEKDYKKQISLTNDLIAKRKDRLTELETANAGLHNEAEYLRNINPWDETSWFDSQGNATEAYNTLYNSSSKEEQEKIKDLFERLSKYKKAYMDNAEEIVGLNKEILQDEEKIWDLRREEFDERLEESEYYIQHSKDFGWENGDNEIAARKRVLDWIQSDYYKSLIKDDEEYYKILEEHRLNYIEAQKEQFDKATDFASSYRDSQKTLLQSYFDVSNSVAEAQHEIDKELSASKTMHEWLDKKTQKLLFNQEDYNKLSKELIDIQSEADRLQKQYQYDLENSTLNTIEEITSQYEMQYETLMKSYEIAKADLEIAKKKQKLNNVLNERNVRMLVNGEWTWVANTQDVIDAQSELADAEYARKTNEAGLRQTESINELTAKQDHLGTIINEFEDGVIDLDEAVERVKDIFNDLPDYIDNAFKKISKASSISSGGSVSSGGGSSGSGSSGGGSSSNLPAYNATATTPGGITTGVYIDANGKTQTSGLQPGTVIHTAAGDYTIKGGTGGNYIVDDKYASGTKYTKSGNLLMGEDGAEMFIKNSGHLIPINQPTIGNFGAGGIVFNQNQMGNLRDWWDLSNINPNVYTHIIQHPVAQPSGDTNCNNIIVNGMNIAKDFEGQQLIDAIQRYVATHKY